MQTLFYRRQTIFRLFVSNAERSLRKCWKPYIGSFVAGGEKVEVFPRAFYQKELDVLDSAAAVRDFDDLKYKSIEELDAAIASKTAQVAAAPEKAVTKPVSFSSNERMESFQFISNEKDQTVSDLFVDRETS